MTDQAKFGVAIEASDKTDKGAKSSEKRLSLIQKRVGEVSKKSLAESEKAATKHGGGILRTFASVEKSAAKVFGGKSISSGIVTRMGAVKESASALGTGLGEAATAGSLLEGALTAVGVVGAATVAVLASVGYAGFKLADSWAKGAASIGRTSDVIGVATQKLQEFQAAGERAGVDKGASTGAIAGIAQTLNDARYGRNQEALALMMHMGMKFKTGSDGQINTSAMTLDLADAISRQKNAQTRRLIASKFGISDAALPMFLSGSGQLKADMADAAKHAEVLSSADVARGKSIVRKGAIVGQLKDRALMHTGMAAAGGEEKVLDSIISGGRSIMDGGTGFTKAVHDDFAPAARTIRDAADKIDRAVSGMVSGTGAGRLTRGGVIVKARQGAALLQKLMGYGFSPEDARALAANAVMESSGNYRARQPGGGGRGLWQWDKGRKNLFQNVMGVSVENSTEDQQIRFMRWELAHTEKRGWGLAHSNGGAASDVAAGFARYVERPKDPGRDSAERAAVAQAMEAIPVHVTIDAKGLPHGSRTTVRAGRSSKPAISHAFVFDPVHGW